MGLYKELKEEIILTAEDGNNFNRKLLVMKKLKNIADKKENLDDIKNLLNNFSILRYLSRDYAYFFEYWFYIEYISNKTLPSLLEQIFYDKNNGAYPEYKYFIENRISDINEKIIYILVINYIENIDKWKSLIDEKKLKDILNNTIFIKHLIKNYLTHISVWMKYINSSKVKRIFNEIENDIEMLRYLIKNNFNSINILQKYVEEENLKKIFSYKFTRNLLENNPEYIEKVIPYLSEKVLKKSIPYTVYKAIKLGDINDENYSHIHQNYKDRREYYFKLIEKLCNIDLSEHKDSAELMDSLKF